jgi:large subunit ribosomal protein L10
VGFAKRNDKLAIVGGALPGNLLTAAQVRALADLPSIDELRARLIGLLTTPAARLVGVLQAPSGQLARVLAARAEQG